MPKFGRAIIFPLHVTHESSDLHNVIPAVPPSICKSQLILKSIGSLGSSLPSGGRDRARDLLPQR
jgi:hypothetical protein